MIDNIEKYMILLADLYAFDSSEFSSLTAMEELQSDGELYEDELEYVAAASAGYREFKKRIAP